MLRKLRAGRRRAGRAPALESLEGRRLPTGIVTDAPITSLIEFQAGSGGVVGENAGRAVFVVTRTGDLSAAAAVKVRTVPVTALANYDYRTFEATLTFGPGESRATFAVDVIDDKVAEAPLKVFTVILSEPSAGVGLAQFSTATVIIRDDEPGSTETPTFLDYGAQGVWIYDRVDGHRKIADVDAQSLTASANRQVYLDLGARGLWSWDSLRGLRQISGGDAQQVVVVNNAAVRTEDVVLADFGASGLWRYSESQGWRQLSHVDPKNILVDGTTVYVDFAHGGLWRWGDELPWYKLNDVSPQGMAADGSLFLDYGPRGLWTWSTADGWAMIADGDPQAIATAGGVYYADYGAAGLWAWNKGGRWNRLGEADPRSMIATREGLFVEYGEFGVWRYTGANTPEGAFRKLSAVAAESMAYSAQTGRLLVDQGAAGLWAWTVDTQTGRTLNAANPRSFSTA